MKDCYLPWQYTLTEIVMVLMLIQGILLGAVLQSILRSHWDLWLGQFAKWVIKQLKERYGATSQPQ